MGTRRFVKTLSEQISNRSLIESSRYMERQGAEAAHSGFRKSPNWRTHDMATVNRGDTGERHESKVHVAQPNLDWRENRYRVEGDIVVECSTSSDAREEPWGFPVTLTLSHDDALKLLADLAARLAMRINPPRPRQADALDGGIDITTAAVP
jgi:hypothetical protein